MGSPDNEEGRWDVEGPQHEVAIESGFWMFETPCTQALWEAVMGKNQGVPDPHREAGELGRVPEVRGAAERSAGGAGAVAAVGGAGGGTACRAGTATYAGDLEILGENNAAPVLDEIAWYGGNCGVGFELPDGWDMSERADKQYKFERGGTRPVG